MRPVNSLPLVLLLCIAAAELSTAVNGQQRTEKDLTYSGFKFALKQLDRTKAYTGISLLVRDIYALVDKNKLSQAQDKYQNTIVNTNPTKRTFQHLAQGLGVAGRVWAGEPTHDMFAAYYGSKNGTVIVPNPKYIDDFVLKQFGAKPVDKGLLKAAILWVVYGFLANQNDECKVYTVETWRNRTVEAYGEMDDSAALYIGWKDGFSLWSLHESTVKKGTKCTSLNLQMMDLFTVMRRQALDNLGKNISVWAGPGGWDQNQERVRAIHIITMGRKMWVEIQKGKQALAYAYFLIIQPYLYDQGNTRKLRNLLTSTKKANTGLVKQYLKVILQNQKPWIGAARVGEVFCDKLP